MSAGYQEIESTYFGSQGAFKTNKPDWDDKVQEKSARIEGYVNETHTKDGIFHLRKLPTLIDANSAVYVLLDGDSPSRTYAFIHRIAASLAEYARNTDDDNIHQEISKIIRALKDGFHCKVGFSWTGLNAETVKLIDTFLSPTGLFGQIADFLKKRAAMDSHDSGLDKLLVSLYFCIQGVSISIHKLPTTMGYYTAAHEALVSGLIHTIKEMHSQFLMRQAQQKSLVEEAEKNIEKSKEQKKEPEVPTDEQHVLRELPAILQADEFCPETEETMESFGILLACFDLSMRFDKKFQLLGKDTGLDKEKTTSSIKELQEMIAELEQLLNRLSTISDAKDEMDRIEIGLYESKQQLAELERQLASPALQSPDRLDVAEPTSEETTNGGSNEYFSLVELPLNELQESDLRAEREIKAIAAFFNEVIDKSISPSFTTYGQCILALKSQYATFLKGGKSLEELDQFQQACKDIMQRYLPQANTPISGNKLKDLEAEFDRRMTIAAERIAPIKQCKGKVSFFSLQSRTSKRSEDWSPFLKMRSNSPK